jgi:ABC-2 type transport system permease protein
VTRTLVAELGRIRSLRQFWLSAAILVAVHVAVSAENLRSTRDAVARITPYGVIEIFAGEPEPARPALVGWLLASSLQMSLFLPVIAALIAGPELGATLLATPRRGRLMVAKAVAASLALLVIALVIATVSGLFLYAEAGGWDPRLPISAGALHGQIAYLLFAVLAALPTFACTLITRSALAGIVITLVLTAGTMLQLPSAVDRLLPLSAGRNLLLDSAYLRLSSGPGPAWAVLVAWALVSVAAAGTVLARRDAR